MKTVGKSMYKALISIAIASFASSALAADAGAIKEASLKEAKTQWEKLQGSDDFKVVVDQVKEANSKYAADFKRTKENSLPEVNKKDEMWRKWVKQSKAAKKRKKSPPKGSAAITAVTENACSQKLKAWKGSAGGAVSEVFITDRVGANVCLADPTSDFDQGDEEKWHKPFLDSVDFFVGDPERDASTGAYQTQVSILIKDGGKNVGVAVVGIEIKSK